MIRIAALLPPACFAALVTAAVAAQTPSPAVQRTVDRFYPIERLHPATAEERHACYEVLETDPTQEPTLIIAAYTDRSTGAVRVLKRSAEGAFQVVADNPDTWALSGTDCQIHLHDLNVDGQLEAIVYFRGPRASTGWILKWDGAALVNMTPSQTNGGRETSVLLSPIVYDLEHTGSLRIVAPKVIELLGPGQQARNPAFVYRMGASKYEAEKAILAIMGFRADVDPRGNQRVFQFVQDSTPPWRIRVINGDREGRNRVTGATISLNDQQVIGPQDVNEKTEFTTKVLQSLTTVNHLTATLSGPGEAYITVVIDDGTKR